MMTPKSLAYMVVAVFVGYMLVSTVPSQVAMYATPTFVWDGEEIAPVPGREFSLENDTLSLEIEELSGSQEDAVESSEAAADLASAESQATTDAVEAAKEARDARSGLEFMGTMSWLMVNLFVALVVYWFARQRFA
jgi:hypothetical protein